MDGNRLIYIHRNFVSLFDNRNHATTSSRFIRQKKINRNSGEMVYDGGQKLDSAALSTFSYLFMRFEVCCIRVYIFQVIRRCNGVVRSDMLTDAVSIMLFMWSTLDRRERQKLNQRR